MLEKLVKGVDRYFEMSPPPPKKIYIKVKFSSNFSFQGHFDFSLVKHFQKFLIFKIQRNASEVVRTPHSQGPFSRVAQRQCLNEADPSRRQFGKAFVASILLSQMLEAPPRDSVSRASPRRFLPPLLLTSLAEPCILQEWVWGSFLLPF